VGGTSAQVWLLVDGVHGLARYPETPGRDAWTGVLLSKEDECLWQKGKGDQFCFRAVGSEVLQVPQCYVWWTAWPLSVCLTPHPSVLTPSCKAESRNHPQDLGGGQG
jgi:hypothetical protein